jgi:hypothetical protein
MPQNFNSLQGRDKNPLLELASDRMFRFGYSIRMLDQIIDPALLQESEATIAMVAKGETKSVETTAEHPLADVAASTLVTEALQNDSTDLLTDETPVINEAMYDDMADAIAPDVSTPVPQEDTSELGRDDYELAA